MQDTFLLKKYHQQINRYFSRGGELGHIHQFFSTSGKGLKVALASASLPVYNIPQVPSAGQKKVSQRLTGAGESVTIKTQKEVLPIDGQSKVKLLKIKVTVSLAGAVIFLCGLCKQSGLIQ